MVLFLFTLSVMLVAVFGMSLGVLLSGRRLRGSCGGLASGSCACRDQGLDAGAGCPKTASDPSERLHGIGELSRRNDSAC